MSPFQMRLKSLMDEYVHFMYTISRSFPREEIYTSVSQLRRSALSVVLNYIEGFGRCRSRPRAYFYEIGYGSLQESLYLLDFSLTESWITKDQHMQGKEFGDEIGAMLWSEIQKAKEVV